MHGHRLIQSYRTLVILAFGKIYQLSFADKVISIVLHVANLSNTKWKKKSILYSTAIYDSFSMEWKKKIAIKLFEKKAFSWYYFFPKYFNFFIWKPYSKLLKKKKKLNILILFFPSFCFFPSLVHLVTFIFILLYLDYIKHFFI